MNTVCSKCGKKLQKTQLADHMAEAHEEVHAHFSDLNPYISTIFEGPLFLWSENRKVFNDVA